MAQCKWCDRSGWFLSLSTNALCQHCEPSFQLDVRQRGRIIQDSQDIIESSRNLETKLSRIQLLLDQLTALQKYEQRGITTLSIAPSEAIRIYERRRTEEIADHAKLAHDDAVAKADLTVSSRSKVTALSKGLLKLRDLAQYSPDNIKELDRDLVQRIAKTTMTDYLEKARKAEFKGQKQKALEQYYEALYFLKHDEVDDSLQTEHIALLEQKIVGLGGSLNNEQATAPSSPSAEMTEKAKFPNDDVLKGYRFSAACSSLRLLPCYNTMEN